MSDVAAPEEKPIYESYSPARLFLTGFVLAFSNFIVFLDLTIANVSVPHISGDLGITPSQGTWVISSYAVAEAICVPLAGWMSQRFGAARVFCVALMGFGFFSFLCGVAVNMEMLILARIGQGISGAPLMPMSQMLLLLIFPMEKRGAVMGAWTMTILLAPAIGPILGGFISDQWSWHWIFLINVPIAAICTIAAFILLGPIKIPTLKRRVDWVGLGLLIFWIGSLQLMLDTGREHDWFESKFIIALAICSVVGFLAFVIWELTEEHPIVDLKIFRHFGYSMAVIMLALCFGAYFAGIVIIPQWLQISLGYSATQAGYATALTAIAALFTSIIVARIAQKFDARALVSMGIFWLGLMAIVRAMFWSTDSSFWALALPQLIQGFGMPFFMVPLTLITLSAVEPEETASAAGMQNFVRTMSVAVSTAVVLTLWGNAQRVSTNDLAGKIQPEETLRTLEAQGLPLEGSRMLIGRMVDQQAMSTAINQIFLIAAATLFLSALVVWLVPKPPKMGQAPQRR